MSGGNSSRNDGITIAQTGRTQIEVKETGKTVNIRKDVHAQTNHYIETSRDFFPDTKLRTYIDFPCFFCLARLLWFASLFGGLGAVSGVPKELPLGFFFPCAVFFLIYCQHEWVNQTSLPVVKQQPVLESQRYNNSFYELTVTELKGVALETYQSGVGFVQLTQGKIRIQAFNKIAIKRMSSAKCQSRVMLVLFFLTSAYNLWFVVLAYSV